MITSTIEKFEVRNRWTNAVQFTAEISVTPDMLPSVKLGLAVRWAVKTRAYLADANLAGADLAYADLAYANLARANLAYSNLARANLADANLADANLAYSNLARANLAYSNLADANLTYANLARANLAYANLAYANLVRAKNADLAIAKTRILPEGALIGYKKCAGGVIAKLRIPEDAPRSHAFGRKCRAKFADVLELSDGEVAFSSHDPKFAYRVGERVEALNWSDDWQDECAGGVHFFITRAEAEAY